MNTRLLMRHPEEELPDRLRKFLPKQTLDDWKKAGRCLAFETPTACAFHICRGTEALMLGYYEALAKHPWAFPKKDWKIYIEQLGVEGAPKTITTRLDEIRDMDRNAYTHPEKTVPLDEAPVLFRLCTAVTFYMCQEMEKLKTVTSESEKFDAAVRRLLSVSPEEGQPCQLHDPAGIATVCGLLVMLW